MKLTQQRPSGKGRPASAGSVTLTAVRPRGRGSTEARSTANRSVQHGGSKAWLRDYRDGASAGSAGYGAAVVPDAYQGAACALTL